VIIDRENALRRLNTLPTAIEALQAIEQANLPRPVL
jgi:hypothetical protein